VPDQVKVIGFDNVTESEFAIPSLSTIDPDHDGMAERAVDLLIRRIEQTEPRPVTRSLSETSPWWSASRRAAEPAASRECVFAADRPVRSSAETGWSARVHFAGSCRSPEVLSYFSCASHDALVPLPTPIGPIEEKGGRWRVALRAQEVDTSGSHPLRVASRLHAFNRYELKYLVPVTEAAAIRDELAQRMDRDQHSPPGGYGVWSLYYDTPTLRFYWEKIEGLKFRRKLRIRHYGDLAGVTDDSTVCVEVKQRVNRVTQKRRIALPYRVARRLCDDRELIDHTPAEGAFVHEVLELIVRLNLRPTAITGYQREALVGRDQDTGVRVTLDRRVRGRDRDFHLGTPGAENRFIVPPQQVVMEVKVNERTPSWVTDLAARRNLSLIRVSKYVQCVETFGRAPRSVFHLSGEGWAPPAAARADTGTASPTTPSVHPPVAQDGALTKAPAK
jgi:PAS domain-containing protein